MSAPVVNQLGPSGINREYVLEVKMSGVYTPVGGVKNFDPTTDNPNNQDDGRYSDGGYDRMNKTGTGWSATCVVSRAPQLSDATTYDPAQEYLRSIGEGQLGLAAQADIRWYEFNSSAQSPRVECYQGLALVSYKGPGGDRTGNREATFSFTGQGQLNKPVHPYPQAAAVPSIGSVTPSTGTTFATAGGTGFRILGAHFTGTTAVTFGGTNATSFILWSDGEITGVAPAKTAGNQSVVVTNGAGASTGLVVVYA